MWTKKYRFSPERVTLAYVVPSEPMAAHLFGYVGEVNDSQVSNAEDLKSGDPFTMADEIDRYEPAHRDHGLAYEAAEFARLLSAGKTESDLLPLDETLRIMQVLDEVRRQLGVRFPGEA